MKSKLSDEWQTPQWLFKELDREFDFDVDLCATAENSKCDIYGVDYLLNEYGSKRFPAVFYGYSIGRAWLEDGTCFMNPPYSNPRPFIEKAWEDSKHCKIVCLVKCDPSTKWWATFWDYDTQCKVCIGTKEALSLSGYIERCYRCKGLGKEPCSNCKGWGRKIAGRNKWAESDCIFCRGKGYRNGPKPGCEVRFFPKRIKFDPPKGYEGKAGSPSFPSALVIMDRRGL